MTIPIKYRKDREKAIASYNFIDIASGTGITTFYAGMASGAFMLSSNTYYGQPFESTYTTTSAYPILADTMNFDAVFNLPQVIKGLCVISAPIEAAGGGANQAKSNYHFALQKISDGVTSNIASGASGFVASLGTKEEISSLTLDIPLTHFKKDDTLRLNCLYYIGQNGGTGNFAIAYDPKNRAGATITTIDTNLVVNLPFRIDL